MKYKVMAQMAKMMMSCDKASFLISKKADGKLSFSEIISLEMHLISCKICRLYEKDIELLNKFLRDNNTCTHHLDMEQKEKIQYRIIAEINKN